MATVAKRFITAEGEEDAILNRYFIKKENVYYTYNIYIVYELWHKRFWHPIGAWVKCQRRTFLLGPFFLSTLSLYISLPLCYLFHFIPFFFYFLLNLLLLLIQVPVLEPYRLLVDRCVYCWFLYWFNSILNHINVIIVFFLIFYYYYLAFSWFDSIQLNFKSF